MLHGPEALDPLLVRVKVNMYPSREVEVGNGPSPADANELAELIGCQPAEFDRTSHAQGDPVSPTMLLASIRLFRRTHAEAARHHQMNLKGF